MKTLDARTITPPNQRPTLRDLARTLNVSHTTVSRVLSGQGADFISATTRERVMEAARQMRYRPNRAARTLATGRTGLISLWVGDVFHPYYVRTMQHVSCELQATEYQTVVFNLKKGAGSPSSVFTAADGVLALDWDEVVDTYLLEEPHPLPLVSMGLSPSRRTDYVAIDVYPGAVVALTHLVETGRKRIVFVSHLDTSKEGDGRHRAYHDVMMAADLPTEILRVAPDNRAGVRETVGAYITGGGNADALFCLSDDIALGAYRALCDTGRRVPDDVAVIGCDGIEETEYLETPLSTISLPIPEMCRIAVGFLQNRIANTSLAPQCETLLPTFLKRKSS